MIKNLRRVLHSKQYLRNQKYRRKYKSTMDDIKIQRIREVTAEILADYQKGRAIDKTDVFSQPDQTVIIDIVNKMMMILFPGYYRDKVYRSYNNANRISVLIEDVLYNLEKQIAISLRFQENYRDADDQAIRARAECTSIEFLHRIPLMREYINTDIEATFAGDPAAFNVEEIVLSYPGLLATSINRIAHELYLLKVPMIPRIMTEYAHSRTGIDIHPGATIGRYLMIDHGTGVVVGETSVIGDRVKIYQGVTIGALSTRGGQMLRGAKRHPTIEDDVTIYAGASILGGDTVIGKGSTIGSNAFITASIAPGSRVSSKTPEMVIRN